MFTISPALSAAAKEPVHQLLTDELLERIRQRALSVDETNAFPHEDFDELKAAGYLKVLAPTDLGGHGWDFQQVVYAQRLLAGAAPATALAINMHLVWNGVARLMARAGVTEFERVFTDSVAGKIYAFGISEPGNDAVLLDSMTTATPDGEGNYTLEGLKIFTSMSPVFDRLGVFGKDESAADAEKLVYGFIDRDQDGWSAVENWDMLGMRGTQSKATKLEGIKLLAENIVRKIPVGPSPDPLIFSIFASFLTLIAAVYTGIGDRAVQLAAEGLQQRSTRVGAQLHGYESQAEDPVMRDRIGALGMEAVTQDALMQQLAQTLDNAEADLGPAWFPLFVTARTKATAYALHAATSGLELVGGASFHRTHELSRIYRDATAGIYHPSSKKAARATVSDWLLG
ncbi:acyl-CoA dehydrogenase family protein [Micrococcoides hystricis]|uniref:Acyl-CoA dehydrogenase family protein n=1 Tax=Micrococcoides hystricis TaxID=1572761 RepID=A0ABV6P776_9MICC